MGILERIATAQESAQGVNRCEHLTASRWKSCDRAMWFTLRNATVIAHPAQRLRVFAFGHATEELAIDWLKAAGVKIHKQQAELVNAHGKPLGHIDGIGEDGGEFFLVEVKSANAKSFKAMVKAGPPDYYYAQVQLYMHHSPQLSRTGARLEKCLFVVLNKDDSELLCLWIPYDAAYAAVQTERIHNIISSEAIPEPSRDYKCAMCDHKLVCEGKIPARIDCRTCANVTPVDGGFTCVHGSSLCGNYITHPQLMGLMGYEVAGVDPQRMAIDYGAFIMAPEGVKIEGKPTCTAEQLYTELIIRETESAFASDVPAP